MTKTSPLRIILSLTLLLIGFVIISSCKDDDEPTAQDKNEIVGSWKLTGVAPATAGVEIQELALLPSLAPCYLNLVYVFKDNNSVTVSGCDQATAILSASGLLDVGATTTWKVENSTLQVKNGTTTQNFALTQAGDDMSMIVVLDETDTNKNVLLSFKRQ